MTNNRKQRILEKLAKVPSIVVKTLKKRDPALLKRLNTGQVVKPHELRAAGLGEKATARAMEHSHGRQARNIDPKDMGLYEPMNAPELKPRDYPFNRTNYTFNLKRFRNFTSVTE